MKKLRFLFVLLMPMVLFNACSSDDDEAVPQETGKTAKFTITVEGITSNSSTDFVSFTIVGVRNDQNSSIWKVNGTARPNEMGIGFGKTDFVTTKTYVVETVIPADAITAGYQVINYGDPLTFSFKAEIDGEVVKDETHTLSGDGDNKDANYSY